MAQIVRMPDGKKVSFPDDMPREEIRALIEDKFPDAAAKAVDPKQVMFDKVAEQTQNMKANQAPMLEGAVNGLEAGGGLTPEEEAQGWERNTLLPRAVNPTTGEQKLAVPGVVMGAYDAFKLPGDVAAGRVDPMSDEGIARSVGFSTIFAPGAPKVNPTKLPGNTLAMVPRQGTKAAVPTAAEIKTVSQAAYGQAKGSQIAPASSTGIVDSLTAVLNKEGLIRPDGKLASTFPAVRTAMKDFAAYKDKPMTFEQFQRLEEGLQTVAASKNKGEARIGEMLLDELDKTFAALPDTAFAKGSGAAAKAGYAGGKEGWALYSKLKRVEKAIADAELNTKGGFAEGLRSEFKTILKSDRKSRGFTDAELKMMRQFVMGGKLDAVTSWLSGLRGLVAGGLSGGVIGAMAVPMAGAAAKGLSGAGAKKAAVNLRAKIAQGNTLSTSGAANGNTLSPSALPPTLGTRALIEGNAERVAEGAALRNLRLQAAEM